MNLKNITETKTRWICLRTEKTGSKRCRKILIDTRSPLKIPGKYDLIKGTPEKYDLIQVTRIAVNTIAVLSMIALFIWQVCSSMLSLDSRA